MKKGCLIILLCIIAIYLASSIRIYQIKVDNKRLISAIDKQKTINQNIDKESNNYKNNFNKKKEEIKDKWDEKEIWIKSKEKIEKALQQ